MKRDMAKWDTVVSDVIKEAITCAEKYNKFNSAHEGYAVLLEEVDELKEEVWKNPSKRDIVLMRGEAVQVAAMAIRFIYDLCLEDVR